MPHAKVDHVVCELARLCLDQGSCTKELVFVRRVATVDELADGLLREFQAILNERIRALGEDPDNYWGLAADEEDDAEGSEAVETGESDQTLGPVSELPYFKALSAVKGSLGRLTKYRNSLGKDDGTLGFLFVRDMTNDHLASWHLFLRALGVSVGSDLYRPFHEDSNRELLLRRCLGHSLRFTDILVDLDVLRRKHRKGYLEKWLGMLANPPIGLNEYFENTRLKLRGWIENFETIVNKCFKGSGSHNAYQDIAERVANYFRGLSPVARRSGRRTDENVVVQFKFPISPNVLICTDVLREGVNLHLFCERVSHYGIAWNSGDLEQRIGRVERADSLFERKILIDNEHKLHVGFPFLSGTLDERQVKKAIRRKREIDALFSIVPPKESGECDDSKETEFESISSPQVFEPILPETREWPSVGTDWPMANIDEFAKWSDELERVHRLVSSMDSFELKGFRYSCTRMMAQFGLLVIEWERLTGSGSVPTWNVCDRLMWGTFERRTQWKVVRTLYFPVGQGLTQEIVEEFWANAEAGLAGTQAD